MTRHVLQVAVQVLACQTFVYSQFCVRVIIKQLLKSSQSGFPLFLVCLLIFSPLNIKQLEPLALLLSESIVRVLDRLLLLVSLGLSLPHDDLREAGLHLPCLNVAIQDIVRVLYHCVAFLNQWFFRDVLFLVSIHEDRNDLLTGRVIVRTTVLLAFAQLSGSDKPCPLWVSFIGRKPLNHVLSELSVSPKLSLNNLNNLLSIIYFELKFPFEVVLAPVDRLSRHAHSVADLLLNQSNFDKSFALVLQNQILLLE